VCGRNLLKIPPIILLLFEDHESLGGCFDGSSISCATVRLGSAKETEGVLIASVPASAKARKH
jgi:hypothetical protein